MPRNPDCTACPLHHGVHTRCVWGYGPPNARIMLVGEAPGADEDREGRPFVGQAGRLLTELLHEAGIDRAQVYISNVAKCRPPMNRTPEMRESDACLHYLLEEINDVNPDIIVCLGGTAMAALTGSKKALASEHGKFLPPRKGLYIDAPIVATYHPASLLRPEGGKYRPILIEDLRFVAAQIHGEERPAGTPQDRWLVFPNTTDEEALGYLKLLKDDTVLAIDLEWTAASDGMVWPWSGRGEPYTISLTARHGERYVSVALAYPLSPKVRRVVDWMLRTKRLIFHNAMADGFWIRWSGVPDYNLSYDTMLLAYLLDETQILKLEKVAPRYAPDLAAGWKGHLFAHRPRSDEEWAELLNYNADDTFATYRAWEGISDAIREQPPARREQIIRLHRYLLLPGLKVLQRASEVGIPIDLRRLQAERVLAQTRREQAAERLSEIAGTTVQLAMTLASSSDKTVAYLKRTYGLELNDSQKDNLSLFADKYPAVEAILAIRSENKLLNTYLEPWTKMLMRQGDRRLHSVYRLGATRTGRLSAESEMGGSIQVAPRDTDNIQFRSLIRAEPGMLLVSADYSQVELRIIAWLSGDPAMLGFYEEGIDLHYATAAYMLACRNGVIPMEEFWPNRAEWIARVTKPERQKAKGTNFGLGFGMGPAKLQMYARTQYGVNITLAEAEQMWTGYFQLYKALPSWQAKAMADAARLGYTETVWGRRRSFDPNDVHAAINTPVQSTASDFGLKAMPAVAHRFDEESLSATVIGSIHDSLVVYASEAHAERAGQILKYEMENVDTSKFGFKIPIPLPAEVKIGETW